MIELSRAEFDAWVKSKVGTMFSHGKIASIEFYYLIWKAGMAAGIERTAQAAGTVERVGQGAKMNETQRLKNEVEQLRDECRQLNTDLTEVNLLITRLVTVCEKQMSMLDKLLDRIQK